MLRIVATNYINPQEREKFLSLVKPLIEESRKESGCIFYSLFEDINQPNCFTFIEEWADGDAIALHNNTPHFTQIVPKIKELSIKEGAVNIYSEVLV